MNLEPIDTSTTAGKIRVMELAEQGRDIAGKYKAQSEECWIKLTLPVFWDWRSLDYAIIAEPVGPDEVWIAVHGSRVTSYFYSLAEAKEWATKHRVKEVRCLRYIRADLAGEGK